MATNEASPMISSASPSSPSTPIVENPIIDSSVIDAQLNPYSLHHSYGPTNVLVTHPLTGAENYSSWSRAMLMALSGKKQGRIH